MVYFCERDCCFLRVRACVCVCACVRVCVLFKFVYSNIISFQILSYVYIFIYKNVRINDKHNELHAFSSCIKTFKIAGRLYFVNSTRSLVRWRRRYFDISVV